MANENDLIWILDNDPSCITFYQQTLGLQYSVRSFSGIDALVSNLKESASNSPKLMIADPANTTGSLIDTLKNNKDASFLALNFPEYIIASAVDDLELMRFFLKAGARDYILKPLRPNELVAKVEKSLHLISNREILILRNDIDGIQVNDLTFREHQLMTIFLSRPNRSVRRDELYNAIWSNVTVNKKTLDVHLFNLRRKIRPHGYDIICQNQVFSLLKQS